MTIIEVTEWIDEDDLTNEIMMDTLSALAFDDRQGGWRGDSVRRYPKTIIVKDDSYD